MAFRDGLRQLWVVAMVATLWGVLAACSPLGPAPTPTPEPTAVPTATIVPTPRPSPTSPPPTGTPRPATPTPRPATATPAPAAKPAARPTVAARATATTSSGLFGFGSGQAADESGAEMMAALMAMMPKAGPPPEGSPAALSRQDLAGRWEGWVTLESIGLPSASPTEREACEKQFETIKGRKLPTAMEFKPETDQSGTVTIINQEMSNDPDEEDTETIATYRYRDGALSFDLEEDGQTSRFEGRTLRTATGIAITGTWKYRGNVDSPGQAIPDVMLEGTWTLTGKSAAGAGRR